MIHPEARSPGAALRALLLPGFLAVGSLVAALGITLQPPASGPVAMVFSPWWSGAEAMSAAATVGAIVRFGAFPFVVIVVPDDAAGHAERRRAGAWLILDPHVLANCSLL